jgi:hypothetical protein
MTCADRTLFFVAPYSHTVPHVVAVTDGVITLDATPGADVTIGVPRAGIRESGGTVSTEAASRARATT